MQVTTERGALPSHDGQQPVFTGFWHVSGAQTFGRHRTDPEIH